MAHQVYRSKARATTEEIEEAVRLAQHAQSMPVIVIGGHDVSLVARRRLHDRMDELARAHGLEDQQGEWGLDPETGEFLSIHPIVEREVES